MFFDRLIFSQLASIFPWLKEMDLSSLAMSRLIH